MRGPLGEQTVEKVTKQVLAENDDTPAQDLQTTDEPRDVISHEEVTFGREIDKDKGESEETISLDEDLSVDQTAVKGNVLKYKSGDEELEVDLSTEEGIAKAKRALELELGSRREITRKGQKMKKEINQLKQQLKNYNPEEMEVLKTLKEYGEAGDYDSLYKILTGRTLDEVLKSRVEKQKLMEQAQDDPELAKAIEREEEFSAMQKKLALIEKKQQQEAERIRQRELELETNSLKNAIIPQLNQYVKEIAGNQKASVQNTVSKLIFDGTKERLKKAAKAGYDPKEPIVIKKVMGKIVGDLKQFYNVGVDEAVDKKIEKVKKTAKEKAQIASTQAYPDNTIDMSELKGKTPMEQFRAIFGKKKY